MLLSWNKYSQGMTAWLTTHRAVGAYAFLLLSRRSSKMHGEVADRLSSKGWAKPIVHKQMPFDDNETPVAYAAHAEDDPLLTTAQTADVLEGDERGVMAMVRSNQLPYETEAHGKRIFYRFRQSAAEAAKPLYRRLR